MKKIDALVSSFSEWFELSGHQKNENIYDEQINQEHLNSLKKTDFIDFFEQFYKAGGGIQSNGQRNASNFREELMSNYTVFKNKILSVFQPGFDLNDWLIWAENFKWFGDGISTIFLNRVNNKKYAIVNKKSLQGLEVLGYVIEKNSGLVQKYHSILGAQTDLMKRYKELKNFYKTDALMHFIISEQEGIDALKNAPTEEYFDLIGLRSSQKAFGDLYDSNSLASKVFYDTRSKFYSMVNYLKKRLGSNLEVRYKERPATAERKKKLKKYILCGFMPVWFVKEKNLFIKLAFNNLDSDIPVFEIEFDQDFKKENKPNNEWLIKNKKNYLFKLQINNSFPKDWDHLLNTIESHLKKMLKFVEKEFNSETESEDFNWDWSKETSDKKNFILYGPPGTGKTFHSITKAISIIEGSSFDQLQEECLTEEGRLRIKDDFDELIKNGQIVFTTFHQNMAYEDFIEGIKPQSPDSKGNIRYEVEDGIFRAICRIAESNWYSFRSPLKSTTNFEVVFEAFQEEWESNKSLAFPLKTKGKDFTITGFTKKSIGFKKASGGETHTLSINTLKDIFYGRRDTIKGIGIYYQSIIQKFHQLRELDISEVDITDKELKKYVIIIDEINRGNVSQIFGELITLIEEDKRIDGKESLTLKLPYSNDDFAIPPNLYLIGTMNTADRSVEALDTALRRRFLFVPMMPQEHLLEQKPEGIDLSFMLQTLNNRLRILKDNDHTIGHAWLWNVVDFKGLIEVFGNKILPLLQEYFYNDYEKLGLVLGDSFFEYPHQRVKGNELATFTGSSGLSVKYKNKYIYTLKNAKDLAIEHFLTLTQSIINPDNEDQ